MKRPAQPPAVSYATRSPRRDYGNGIPMTLNQKFDTSGREILSERRYSYSFVADGSLDRSYVKLPGTLGVRG